MKLEEAKEKFRVKLREFQALKDSTVDAYTKAIKYLKRRTGNVDVEDLSISDVEDFLLDYDNRSTRFIFYNAIKSFAQAMHLPDNFRKKLKDIQIRSKGKSSFEERIKEVILTEEEVKRIINAAEKLRNRVMLQIGYEAALRSGELVPLQMNNINLEEGTVKFIPEKWRQPTTVEIPFSSEALSSLKAYLESVGIEEGYLFPSGRSKEKGHLSQTHLVSNIFKDVMYAAGFEHNRVKKTRYHDFARHSRCTNLLKKGTSFFAVNRIMHHKKLQTTLRYAHISGREIKEMPSLKEMKEF